MPGIGVGIGIGLANSGAAGSNPLDPDLMVFSVKTDNTGTSSDTSFTLPLLGTNNIDIDWGDGNSETSTSAVAITHDYGVGNEGTYEIQLGGTNNTLNTFRFDGAGDRLKFLDISQHGTIEWQILTDTYRGCTNLTMSASDAPDYSNVTAADNAYDSCTSLLELPALDLSTTTTLRSFIYNCTSLTTVGAMTTTSALLTLRDFALGATVLTSFDDSLLVTSGVTSMTGTFRFAGIDIDVSNWLITDLLTALNMMGNSPFSQANYDLMLVGWEGQTHNNSVPFHAGTATYSAGAPATAHAALISDSWSLTDGGPA